MNPDLFVFNGLDYRHALILAFNYIEIDTFWATADPLNVVEVKLPTQPGAFPSDPESLGGARMSTVMDGITAHDKLVRQVRILALGLDLMGEVACLMEERTGYRTSLEMALNEDVQWVYEQLAKRIHPEQFVYHGEASFDRIRRATAEMLRAVIMIADAADSEYFHRAAHTCREELERRGISE